MASERMTTVEAAEYLGFSPYTLKLARSRHKDRLAFKSPPFYWIGGRVFYDQKDLDAWLKACRKRQTKN